jgi:hypothetical protein
MDANVGVDSDAILSDVGGDEGTTATAAAGSSSCACCSVRLVCGGTIAGLAFGISVSFGLFVTPITSDLGIWREVISLAVGCSMLVNGQRQRSPRHLRHRAARGAADGRRAGCHLDWARCLGLLSHHSFHRLRRGIGVARGDPRGGMEALRRRAREIEGDGCLVRAAVLRCRDGAAADRVGAGARRALVHGGQDCRGGGAAVSSPGRFYL